MGKQAKPPWMRFGPLVLLLGAVGSLALGCSSLSKAELERRVLGLNKNLLLEGELSRGELTMDVDGSAVSVEYVFLKAEGEAPTTVDRTPVVLIHGTPSTLCAWTNLIYGNSEFPGLRAERDVYAIEVSGHGFAPGDLSPYGFDRCAQFIAAAIRDIGLEQVYLVGSSYGGEFVWRAAADNPDLIAGMVLMDSSGYVRREEDWLSEEVIMRENRLASIGWMLNARDRVESALAPHFREIPPDVVEEFFLVCENKQNWKAMIDLVRDENGTRQADIASIAAPTLLIWGENDLAYPPEVYAERFDADLPDSELLVMPQAGHYPYEERPEDVVREMNRFFDRVE